MSDEDKKHLLLLIENRLAIIRNVATLAANTSNVALCLDLCTLLNNIIFLSGSTPPIEDLKQPPAKTNVIPFRRKDKRIT